MAEIANLTTVRIRRRRVLDGLIHEDQRAGRRYARGNRGILPTVAWFSGVSRRMVAMIAAGRRRVTRLSGHPLRCAPASPGPAAKPRAPTSRPTHRARARAAATQP